MNGLRRPPKMKFLGDGDEISEMTEFKAETRQDRFVQLSILTSLTFGFCRALGTFALDLDRQHHENVPFVFVALIAGGVRLRRCSCWPAVRSS